MDQPILNHPQSGAIDQQDSLPRRLSRLRRYVRQWFCRRSQFRFQGFGSSQVGIRRSVNADVFQLRNDIGLYVIADGFGEGYAGEEAAYVGVNRFVQRFIEKSALRFIEKSAVTAATLEAHSIPFEEAEHLLNQSFAASVAAVNNLTQQYESGCGASMTAIVCVQGKAIFGSIGNCRGYVLRRDRLRQVTTDDTVAAEFARNDPRCKNSGSGHYEKMLTKHLGDAKTLIPSISVVTVRGDDRLLLLTDGIYRSLDQSSVSTLAATEPIASASRRLVSAAGRAGNPDDCAAVLVSAHALPKELATERDSRHAPRAYASHSRRAVDAG